MTLTPRFVAAAVQLDVFEPGDVLTQKVARRRARMRILRALNHQHSSRDSRKDLRLAPLALKSQNVLPRLGMPQFIERQRCGTFIRV